MHVLYDATRYIVARGVPGDIVECGVWRGGSSMLAALTLQQLGDTSRTLWLYDTFAGMSPPTAADVERETGLAAQSYWDAARHDAHVDWCYAPLPLVQANMRATGYPHISYVEGRVEDTIPARAPAQIAILRLDTDWYESTRHELDHLWPRLADGGVLIVDDYGHWEGARRAVDEFFADRPIFLVRIDSTGRIAMKLPEVMGWE